MKIFVNFIKYVSARKRNYLDKFVKISKFYMLMYLYYAVSKSTLSFFTHKSLDLYKNKNHPKQNIVSLSFQYMRR